MKKKTMLYLCINVIFQLHRLATVLVADRGEGSSQKITEYIVLPDDSSVMKVTFSASS